MQHVHIDSILFIAYVENYSVGSNISRAFTLLNLIYRNFLLKILSQSDIKSNVKKIRKEKR